MPSFSRFTTETAARCTSGEIRKMTALMVTMLRMKYGEVEGPIYEGLAYAAHTRKGRVRAAMAEALFAAHRSGRVRVAMARGADLYGPGVLDSTRGQAWYVPNPPTLTQRELMGLFFREIGRPRHHRLVPQTPGGEP